MADMNRYEAKVRELKGEPLRGDWQHVSEADLKQLEATLGHALPEDYREFLRDFGGCLFHHEHLAPACRSGDLFARGEGVWVGPSDFEWFDQVLDWATAIRDGTEDYRPREVLTIATNGNINICLAFRGPHRSTLR